jgi:DNA-binding MarR family transcriptional regulator
MSDAVSMPSPDLDALLCFAVYSTGLAFNRVYRKPLEALGLTYPQYLVMAALWAQQDVTVGALCDKLSLDTNTLTPLLKRLEAMGLVTRRRSSADERRVLVGLTAQGRKLQEQSGDVTRCIAEAIGLPFGEIGKLTRELRALREKLARAASTFEAA